ncbi:MAG: hypothetical protein BYD32DRAFT_415500 [Podila humilis]|nr:MAG: hypothetical protein BYD32DRAFT_415500 [Podila humilis]
MLARGLGCRAKQVPRCATRDWCVMSANIPIALFVPCSFPFSPLFPLSSFFFLWTVCVALAFVALRVLVCRSFSFLLFVRLFGSLPVLLLFHGARRKETESLLTRQHHKRLVQSHG